MNTNFKVIGLTCLRIEPESAAAETDALTTRLSELLNSAPVPGNNFHFGCGTHGLLFGCNNHLDRVDTKNSFPVI